MSKPFTPRPYQDIIVQHQLEHPRGATWAGMGLGKTVSTLTAMQTRDMIDGAFPALVVAPLRVAQSTWPDEAAKWDHLSGLRVVPVVGTLAERYAALKQPGEVYTTNYENLEWLHEALGAKWKFRTVIADESTRLKGFRLRQGGKRAKALARHAHTDALFWQNLTGTPASNGLQDLWGAQWYMDSGKRLGRTYDDFRKRWFQKSFDGYSMEPLPYAMTEIQDRLRDVCLSLDAKDWFDIREPIVTDIYVDLPNPVRHLYRDMERKMFMQIEGEGIEAFNAASRTIKCLQIANGAAYREVDVTDDTAPAAREWFDLHDAKIQALESVVQEAAGMPVLVAYHFKSDLVRLRKAFPQGRELDKKPQTIRDWNAGKIPILFAHPASAGHGLSLQDGGNIIVYFALWWDLELHQQILERIGPTRQAQAGHDRPVFVYRILARDTVDEMVLARLEGKGTVQQILLDALKRKGK